jgi:tetratricopeptide (TPR) repeat protein
MSVRLTRRGAGRILLAVLLLAVIGFGLWMAARPLLANYYERQAARSLERQRYSQALESYRHALRYRPDSAKLHLLAARTARQAGDYPTAREHLHACRELQHGTSEELQVEWYMLRAQTGEVDEVVKALAPYVIQEGPLTPLVLESLTRGYMGKYRADLAWGYLNRWLELQPTNVAALFWRATWYSQQQNTRESAADCRRALELDPDRTDIRLIYAEILRAEKDFTAVAEQYRAALRSSPENAEAILGLAQAHVELGRMDEARRQLEAMPPDRRDSGEYLSVSGLVELRSDRPEKAEPLLRQSLEKDPRNLDTCYNWMLCLTRLGRDAEAARARARFEQIERDQKRLIELTTKEFRAQPSNAELRCELAEIYARMAMPDRGAHWLHVALKLDPSCRRAHELLRDYFESRGGPEAAERADFHRRQLAKLQ